MSIEKFSGQFNNEANGVTISINSTIQSITDIDALGLYIYLSSKPDTWKIHYKDIMRHFNIGEEKAYRLMNVLLSAGLLIRTEVREKGRFKEYLYTLYLKPNCTSQPLHENQGAVNPGAENQGTYKTKIKQNKEGSGVQPHHAPIFDLFIDRNIPCPKDVTDYNIGILKDANNLLEIYGFDLEGYLDYLVNECAQWVFEPYDDGKVNGFYILLRPMIIKNACSGKYEDRLK
jgi:predicted transcriptional regulator